MPPTNPTLLKLCRDNPGIIHQNDIALCEFCPSYNYKYNPSDGKSKVLQHIRTKTHQRMLDNYESGSSSKPRKQAKVSIMFEEGKKKKTDQQQFNQDLTKFMIQCDIPFHKMKNKAFINFINKHTNFECPDESNIRKNYVDELHEDTIKKIRDTIGDDDIYMIVDETTDACKRYVCNVMVGKMNGEYSKAMLLTR